MSSCNCEDPVTPAWRPTTDICPPGDPCQNAPTPGSCNPDTHVTVVNSICGVGVWGSYWLQLDNGTLLQPWLSNNTAPVQENEKYKISYSPVTRDGLYDSVIICQAVPPASTAVRINCMEPVATPTTH